MEELVEDVFNIPQSLSSKLKETAYNEPIKEDLARLESYAQEYLKKIAKAKQEQQTKLVKQYADQYMEVKTDYDRFMEANNEQDLERKLDEEKDEIVNKRAKLLQNTFKMSLSYAKKSLVEKEKKVAFKELKELDDEVRFLMEQIEAADHQDLELKNKLEEITEDIIQLNPDFEDLEDRDIVKLLQVANHGKRTTVPDMFDTKTKTDYQFRISKMKQSPMERRKGGPPRFKDSQNSQLFFTQEYREDPQKTRVDLMNILEFVTENKYVVEAIFENVLLESQLLNQVFTSFNDAEKKVLMESLMLNEEFKEYIYQKIAKEELNKLGDDYDFTSEDNFYPKKKEEHEEEPPTAQFEEIAENKLALEANPYE